MPGSAPKKILAIQVSLFQCVSLLPDLSLSTASVNNATLTKLLQLSQFPCLKKVSGAKLKTQINNFQNVKVIFK